VNLSHLPDHLPLEGRDIATTLGVGDTGEYGGHFGNLESVTKARFHQLVKEHTYAVNEAASVISALPGTAQPFAATQAMSRFLNHNSIGFPALLELSRSSFA
jgi:hypothetical protein